MINIRDKKRAANPDKNQKLKTLCSYRDSILVTHSFSLYVLLMCLCTVNPLYADTISTTNKYAWSENSGWLNFSTTLEQVSVYNDHLEGYVWSESVGWIRLGTVTKGTSHTYTNTSATTYGVNNDGTGNLTGYGWSENAGFTLV